MLSGRLVAWDPKSNSEVWRVEHKGSWNGGTLATAGGLVFQGTADAKFKAFSADSGKELWEFPTQTGVVAPAITYEIDGEQYVSVNVGWGGAFALVFGEFVQAESVPNVSRVLTFKLGADGKLPRPPWKPTVVFNPPEQTASLASIGRGHRLYQDTCMGCHGLNAVSGLLIPDLRGSDYLHDEAGWNAVVLQGSAEQQRDAVPGEQHRRGGERSDSRLRGRTVLARPAAAKTALTRERAATAS